jgi:hypothetical protein
MENLPPQFLATGLGGGAVSQDGSSVTIEFEADDARLWVTLPATLLPRLQTLAREIDAVAMDARNGFGGQMYVPVEK